MAYQRRLVAANQYFGHIHFAIANVPQQILIAQSDRHGLLISL